MTLLLDLDDTLLSNDMDQFLPAYLDRLASYMGEHAPADQFISQLMASTRQMMGNSRPDSTLKEVFDRRFYPALGLEGQDVRSHIDRFYADAFPALRAVTETVPGAQELIYQARQRDYCLVIATNPLFPRQATLERIDWAGLAPNDFCLITTYESFHFAKPNPAYYAEILGRLGWPDGPVVMVGNDPQNDILPARVLGLATFWVNPDIQELSSPVQAAGRLQDILPWIDRLGEEAFIPEYGSADSNLAVLTATPAVLKVLLHGLVLPCWPIRPNPHDWSATEIICHMRDVDREVNLPRIRRVLENDNPFIQGADTDPWATERQYNQQDGRRALSDFMDARMEIVDRLGKLTGDQWQRTARHTIFGPTTLEEICRIMAAHDRLHIRQISALLPAESLS
jgi:FMN phosphatase YigB (HAD superfamily)